jgi:hypothetical protein
MVLILWIRMYDSVWGGHNKHASNLHDMKFECFGICMGTYFSIYQGLYMWGRVKFKDFSRTFKAMYQKINKF